MAVKRAPGTLKIDQTNYQLLQTGNESYSFERHDEASPLPISTPEESVLSRHNPSYLRTIGQLDWSAGIGLSSYVPGDKRMAWSNGPSGENLRQIHRAHEVRRVALDTAGSVTSFFVSPDNKQYLICGDYIRRITPTLNVETVAAAKVVNGVGDSDGIWVDGRAFTESSPIWWDGSESRVNIGATGGEVVTWNGLDAGWILLNTTPDTEYTYWTVGIYRDAGASQRLWAAGPSSNSDVFVKNLPVGQDPADPSNWSAEFLLNRAAPITSISALRDNLIITTNDGMIYRLEYDQNGGVPIPMNDRYSAIANATAGRHTRIWNGMLIVPLARGLYIFEENQNANGGVFYGVSPEFMVGSDNPVKGQPTAICTSDAEWLYAAFYNPSDPTNTNLPTSYIYKARRPYPGEQVATRLIWQPACMRISNEKVTAMEICTLGTNPVLMMGTDNPAVHFVTLPRFGSNALSDANCRSTITANYCDLPLHDGLSPNTVKSFWRIRLTTRDVSTAEYINVWYAIDSGDFVQCSTAAQESPFVSILLPQGTRGRSIAVRLEFVGTTALDTFPTVESVAVDFTAKSDITSYADVQVYVARNQLTWSGLAARGTRNRLAYLYRLVTEESPVSVTGPDGNTIQAQLDGAVGLNVKAVAHTATHQEPGFICRFRINLYDELTAHDPARWDIDPWTEGALESYWGT